MHRTRQGRRGLLAASAVMLLVGATACVPPPQPGSQSYRLAALTGTVARLEIQTAGAAVTYGGVVTGPVEGLGARITGTPAGLPQTITLEITVPVATAIGTRTLTLSGRGCTAPLDEPACPEGNLWNKDYAVTLVVTAPTTAIPTSLPEPAPDRWVETTTDSAVLPSTVELTVRPGVTPASVSSLAASLGASVSGADTEFGVYWLQVPDVDAAIAALEVNAAVRSVGPLLGYKTEPSEAPLELVQSGYDRTWTFRQAGVDNAWGAAPGIYERHLGVIDLGIYGEHPDLAPNLASYDPVLGDARRAWSQGAAVHSSHGTKVAGTMCAAGNNSPPGDAVGVDYGCRLHALDVAEEDQWTPVWTSLGRWRAWLLDHPEIRVANISLVMAGAHENNGCANSFDDRHRADFKRFFDSFAPGGSNTARRGNRDVLFVLGANNCGKADNGQGARESIRDAVPQALSNDPEYPTSNVLSVSATTRNVAGPYPKLAAYSTVDGEIAAPGGDSEYPVFADTYGCIGGGYCIAGHAAAWGTSIAAPYVSGIAGLMLSVNPRIDAPAMESCLKQAATTPVFEIKNGGPRAGLPSEIRAEQAVDCAASLVAVSGVTAVTTGRGHACSLQGVSGAVKCWGLGDLQSATVARNNPVSVPGVQATRIDAGNMHTCALTTDAQVKCWGHNFQGQVSGQGSPTTPAELYYSAPRVVPGLSNVVAMSAGADHTCAVVQGGAVKCWGSNAVGGLGDGTSGSLSSPMVSVAGLAGAVDVSAGNGFTCALLQAGNVKCWGGNVRGQLGNGLGGYGTDSSVPVDVVGLDSVESISAGGGHVCAKRIDDSVWCWGSNFALAVGNGSNQDSYVPVPVTNGYSGGTAQVDAGASHTCSVGNYGGVECWGQHSLGDFNPQDLAFSSSAPTQSPMNLYVDVSTVDVGDQFACAVLVTTNVKCWGANTVGQLGDGTRAGRLQPALVVLP